MELIRCAIGAGLVLFVLWEGFETIVLPRRVTRRLQLTRFFYSQSWHVWTTLARWIFRGKRQETFLGYYGPLSLPALLTLWAGGLTLGFALLYWGVDPTLGASAGHSGFFTALYLSGTTFFTLGLGDVLPRVPLGRALTVVEAGMGFGFLALIIAYLPALNQSFSGREVSISLLDSRAGSPPTAAEMLFRHAHDGGFGELQRLLHEWEGWSAEFLESHLSFPPLAYFRSQHDNQSWLGALTAILDACALVMTGVEGASPLQARRTFAIARHALVDLSLVFQVHPKRPPHTRLPPSDLVRLREHLSEVDLHLQDGPEADRRLEEYRDLYEPYVYALARHLRITLPPWRLEREHLDNWQTSAWERGGSSARSARRGHRSSAP